MYSLDVQTEKYLEELSDKVPEFDASTQTDHIMDQPPVPMYIPQEEGIHVGTQVEDDLFDFDYEWFAIFFNILIYHYSFFTFSYISHLTCFLHLTH